MQNRLLRTLFSESRLRRNGSIEPRLDRDSGNIRRLDPVFQYPMGFSVRRLSDILSSERRDQTRIEIEKNSGNNPSQLHDLAGLSLEHVCPSLAHLESSIAPVGAMKVGSSAHRLLN
jgi:hypothetical protein